MNYQTIEQELAELPLYIYAWVDPQSLEFSDRVRHICQTECAMYGKSWACPPGVGSVETCQEKCMRHKNCLMIATAERISFKETCSKVFAITFFSFATNS